VLPSVWAETFVLGGFRVGERRTPKIVSFSEAIDGLEVRSVDRSTDRRSPP